MEGIKNENPQGRGLLRTYAWDLALISALVVVLGLSLRAAPESERSLGEAARDAMSRQVGAPATDAPVAGTPGPARQSQESAAPG